MRAHLPSYELQQPKNLAGALALLDKEPGKWRLFAGGTDLMVLFEAGKLAQKHFLNLWNIQELKKIEEKRDAITLGALVTYAQVRANKILNREFPMIVQAAAETGAVAIQNRGTIGGNLANASPAADTPPALLAYDAEVELTSNHGRRWIPMTEFFLGYKNTALKQGELITRIRLKRSKSKKPKQLYRKVGTRKAQAISKVCFAGIAEMKGKQIQSIRIAMGSVAPITLRCTRTETFLTGKKVSADLVADARELLAAEISPIDDVRSTREYRLRVSQNLLESFLKDL